MVNSSVNTQSRSIHGQYTGNTQPERLVSEFVEFVLSMQSVSMLVCTLPITCHSNPADSSSPRRATCWSCDTGQSDSLCQRAQPLPRRILMRVHFAVNMLHAVSGTLLGPCAEDTTTNWRWCPVNTWSILGQYTVNTQPIHTSCDQYTGNTQPIRSSMCTLRHYAAGSARLHSSLLASAAVLIVARWICQNSCNWKSR